MTWTIRYVKLRRSFSLHAHALSGPIPSIKISANFVRRLERAKGIEPSTQAWEARILPLNYARPTKCIIVYGFMYCKQIFRKDASHGIGQCTKYTSYYKDFSVKSDEALKLMQQRLHS